MDAVSVCRSNHLNVRIINANVESADLWFQIFSKVKIIPLPNLDSGP
jgi:hypothetical protein